MAEEPTVPGVLELLIGASQGPPPAGRAYIYCLTPDQLILRTLADGEIIIAAPGLRRRESHIILAVSETEVTIP